MNLPLRSLITLICLAPTAQGWGHGTPIHVEAVGNRLEVGTGIEASAGFAERIFVEDDADGGPILPNSIDVPGLGPSYVWDVPGLDIYGLAEHSGLFLELIARPGIGANPADPRVLWYWNPSVEAVEPAPAPAAMHLLASESRTMSSSDSTAPPPLQLAEPVSADMGFHNHSLLKYALSDEPPAASGAYGFFARLTSHVYEPSAPFLVVINFGTDHHQMVPAALAINAAAADPLPGDYNGNGRVDAADYTVWRDTLGSATRLAADGSGNALVDMADYHLWRENFGRTVGEPGGAAATATAVPESATARLAASGCVVLLLAGLRRMQLSVDWFFSAGRVRPRRGAATDELGPSRPRFAPFFRGVESTPAVDSLPAAKLF